jgi:hypothetical protein
MLKTLESLLCLLQIDAKVHLTVADHLLHMGELLVNS